MLKGKLVIGATVACVAVTDWDYTLYPRRSFLYKKHTDNDWTELSLLSVDLSNNAYRKSVDGLTPETDYDFVIRQSNDSSYVQTSVVTVSTLALGTIGLVNGEGNRAVPADKFLKFQSYVAKINALGISSLSFLSDITDITVEDGGAISAGAYGDFGTKRITFNSTQMTESSFVHEMRHIFGIGARSFDYQKYIGGIAGYFHDEETYPYRWGAAEKLKSGTSVRCTDAMGWDDGRVDNYYSFMMGAYDSNGTAKGKVYLKGVHSTIRDGVNYEDYFMLKAMRDGVDIYDII